MADDEERLAASFEIGEQMSVEDFLEMGILIGRPLVEEVDRAVFQIGGQQGEALALTLRQVERRETPLVEPHLAVELEHLQVFGSPLLEVGAIDSQQPVEQEEIGEDDGEELAVAVPVLIRHRDSVEQQLAPLRNVEAEKQLRQRRLAAAIAADQEHRLARSEFEVQGAQHERLGIPFVAIAVLDPGELDRAPGQRAGLSPGGNRFLRRALGQREAEALDFLNPHAGSGDGREHVEQQLEGGHDVQDGQRVAGQRPPISLAGGMKEQHDPDHQEEQHLSPGIGGVVSGVAGHVVPAQRLRRGLQEIGDERMAAAVVDLELLGSLRDSTQVLEHVVPGLALTAEMTAGEDDLYLIGGDADRHGDQHDQEQLPGEYPKVDETAGDQGEVQHQLRDAGDAGHDAADVLGDRGQEPGGADLLELA